MRVCGCAATCLRVLAWDVARLTLPINTSQFLFCCQYVVVPCPAAAPGLGCRMVIQSSSPAQNELTIPQESRASAILVCWSVHLVLWPAQSLKRQITETASGHSQWDPPAADPQSQSSPAQSSPHHAKRRQYAAGQTQVYYGAAEAAPDPSYGAAPGLQPQPAGGQLFTPGLAAENQFQTQQVQAPGQAPYYGQQQPAQPSYADPNAGYGAPQQQTQYIQPGADALAGQFGQMGLAGGQKQFQLFTTNLLTSPPEPKDLHRPPPEIRLPPNSSITPSPLANADPSYQRCTVNAIPTTSSLLSKAKIPLALVLTPYRSLKDGDEPVPVVTDTVIARCRRCRTYINPYVQFIDGGNRCVMSIFCLSRRTKSNL